MFYWRLWRSWMSLNWQPRPKKHFRTSWSIGYLERWPMSSSSGLDLIIQANSGCIGKRFRIYSGTPTESISVRPLLALSRRSEDVFGRHDWRENSQSHFGYRHFRSSPAFLRPKSDTSIPAWISKYTNSLGYRHFRSSPALLRPNLETLGPVYLPAICWFWQIQPLCSIMF